MLNFLPDICIVILTHNRLISVTKAVESVLSQTYPGYLELQIVADRCSYTNFILERYECDVQIIYNNCPRRINLVEENIRTASDISEHLAHLRNKSVQRTKCEYISFLDDDNVLLPEHFNSLIRTMYTENVKACHSWRRLQLENGLPYYIDRFPWSGDQEDSRISLKILRQQGVFLYGSDILRDRVTLRDGSLGMVDTSAWVIHRTLLISTPFPEARTSIHRKNNFTEDDLLLEQLVEMSVPVACSYMATLIYRLGGYSNINFKA